MTWDINYDFFLRDAGDKSGVVTNDDPDVGAADQPMDISTLTHNERGREGKRKSAQNQSLKTENNLAQHGIGK